jgi:hypothetical protein
MHPIRLIHNHIDTPVAFEDGQNGYRGIPTTSLPIVGRHRGTTVPNLGEMDDPEEVLGLDLSWATVAHAV